MGCWGGQLYGDGKKVGGGSVGNACECHLTDGALGC